MDPKKLFFHSQSVLIVVALSKGMRSTFRMTTLKGLANRKGFIKLSDEDESSTTKKSRTYKAHAEDASKTRIAALQVTISKLEQSENRGLLTESGYAELQEAKKSIKKETMNLEKLKSNQKASKNIGKRKKKLFKLW